MVMFAVLPRNVLDVSVRISVLLSMEPETVKPS